MFDELVKHRVREIMALYKISTRVEHAVEKGWLREIFLKNIIEGLLPEHFGIGSGIVVDAKNKMSPQVDLVIYDKRTMPPILDQGGRGIYPFDSVLRVIEVKSKYRNGDFCQFYKLIQEFSPSNLEGLKSYSDGNLEKSQLYYPLVCLYSYGAASPIRLKKNIDIYRNFTMVACLGEKGVIQKYSGEDSTIIKSDGWEENTILFIKNILDRLEETANSRSKFPLSDWLKLL